MFGSAEVSRLLGVRYRLIAAGLGVAAAVLIALLIANIFQDHDRILGSALSPEALQHLQGEGIRLTALSLLLAITAAAAVLALRSHQATTERLTWVQNTTKTILESLAGGVLTLDLEGKVGIINRAAREILEIGDAPAGIDLAWLARRQLAFTQLIRQSVLERKYVQDQDLRFVNSRGAAVVVRITTCEQKDEKGERVGVIVLVKDVTRLVAMDQELRKRDRLAAAGTLAAGVAHEIRNPLSALELNIRLLRDEVLSANPSREDIESYFDVLVAETRRLNRITANFLQLARPAAISRAPVFIDEPLLQVIRLLELEAKEKAISFNVRLPERFLVLGDTNKLEQLFLNILINAMQAMPEGGVVHVEARALSEEDGRFVDVSFADNGVGIPPENLARLFDPYFTTREGGTGLGLPIADRIATDHGGKIFVESAPGAGTTMTVRLPLAPAEDDQQPPSAAVAAAPAPAAHRP